MKKAIGIRTNGEKVEFDIVNGILDCSYNHLSSLTVPDSVTKLDCSYNQLKKVEDCGGSKRTIYKIGLYKVLIGCTLYNKENAIIAIKDKYTGESANEYIDKVESLFN